MTDRLVFKAEDFGGHHSYGAHNARIAQAKFDAWLAAQPEVYGKVDPLGGSAWSSKEYRSFNDTHRARLVAIEPLKPDEQREEE